MPATMERHRKGLDTPPACALARFTFPFKNVPAFPSMSFRSVPFIAFVQKSIVRGLAMGAAR